MELLHRKRIRNRARRRPALKRSCTQRRRDWDTYSMRASRLSLYRGIRVGCGAECGVLNGELCVCRRMRRVAVQQLGLRIQWEPELYGLVLCREAWTKVRFLLKKGHRREIGKDRLVSGSVQARALSQGDALAAGREGEEEATQLGDGQDAGVHDAAQRVQVEARRRRVVHLKSGE
eukprot:4343462-Pleurochrysis_carterae.AAC.1